MPGASTSQYVFRAGEFSTRDLLCAKVEGTEAISQLFHYRLHLVSPSRDIKASDIVGEAAVLTTMINPEQEGGGVKEDATIARFANGIVSRFEHLYDGTNYSHYEAEMVPFAWLLRFREKSRIFQQLDVQKIVTQILQDAGLTSEMFRFALNETYPVRDYCTQYRESDWGFVERLLEEEGIFYFFEHKEDSHVIVFGDLPQVNVPIPGTPKIPFRPPSAMVATDHISHFSVSEEIRTGAVELRDFEFTKPVPTIKVEEKAELNSKLEHYDYPSTYIANEGGTDSKSEATTKTLAKVRLEEFQATRVLGKGRSNCTRFIVGSTFELTEHSRDTTNDNYLLTELRIRGAQPEVGQEDNVESSESAETNYENNFNCTPVKTAFRPPRISPRPFVRGNQTAIVVGPAGEEIYPDEYGRVKVKFPWDREGEYDEKCSCWVRVSQSHAGGQYGFFFLPRIGQEVVVAFLEGNPDQPIIVGRVYNKDHMPPYSLPDNKTISTIRTNSSPNKVGANELRFEDKADSEQIFLHAQKDLHVRALNDRLTNVGTDGEGSSHETIEKEYRQLVKDNRSRTVDKDEAIEVTGDRSLTVSGDVLEKYAANQKKEVATDYHLKGGANVVIEAGAKLTIKVGGNFVVIDPSGVSIKGSMVKINSGGSAGSFSAPSPASPAIPDDADEETPGKDIDYTGTKKPPEALEVPKLPEASWVGIELKDEDGNPVPGERYRVTTSDGQVIEGNLDVNGQAKVRGIEEGNCKVTFPYRDGEDWEKG